jgi:hypothetical protein
VATVVDYLSDLMRMVRPDLADRASRPRPSPGAPARSRPARRQRPAAPAAPAVSRWAVGPRTADVLALYGLPAPAVVAPGVCVGHTMLSGLPPMTCGSRATHVASLGRSASLPVCASHAHVLISRHRADPSLPRPSLRCLLSRTTFGLDPEYCAPT